MSIRLRGSDSRAAWLLISLLVLCVLAYACGLAGGFLFDDFSNIVDNPSLRALGTSDQNWLAVALSSPAGQLRRPISLLSFGLNVAAFGMSPFAFKLVNLGIHLANGVLVFLLSRRLIPRLLPQVCAEKTDSDLLACVVAGLWLLHPLNVSSVLYIVQRMNQLATLFMLCGFVSYVEAREQSLKSDASVAKGLLGLLFFGAVATLCKENGALVLAYALVIEATCYRFAARTTGQVRTIKGFFVATVALPAIVLLAAIAMHPQWITGGYAGRDFSLYQRLLSESRILCDYLLWIVLPNPAWMGIYHDDIAVSTGLLAPVSTAISLCFLTFAVAMAVIWHRRSPGIAFGLGWFLVGHAMESTVLPLELVFEHRNYLPMAGLVLGAICTLVQWSSARSTASTRIIVASLAIIAVAGLTTVRAATWGDPLRMALSDAAHHPDSSRFQYAAGSAILAASARTDTSGAAELEARPYFARAAELDPHQVYPVASLVLVDSTRGPVAPALLQDLEERLRHATSYVQANPLLNMLSIASKRNLSLTPQDVAALTGAALANPHFPPYIHAMIRNDYGAYLFNVEHDPQAAIALTIAAAREDPKNPYFEMNLAKMAIALGQREEALKHLSAAYQLDKASTYANELSALRKQLAAQSP